MNIVIYLAFALLLAAILLSLVRLRRGPSVIDRILALDLVATCVVGMVVLLSVAWNTAAYLEVILIVSLLGFFTTVSFVYYLHRHKEDRYDDSAPPPQESEESEAVEESDAPADGPPPP